MAPTGATSPTTSPSIPRRRSLALQGALVRLRELRLHPRRARGLRPRQDVNLGAGHCQAHRDSPGQRALLLRLAVFHRRQGQDVDGRDASQDRRRFSPSSPRRRPSPGSRASTSSPSAAGLLGNWVGDVLGGHGQPGFTIDRAQRVRGIGNFADVKQYNQALSDAQQWPWKANLAYASYEARFFNWEAEKEAALLAEKATVVPFWTGETLSEFAEKDIDFPSAAEMAKFDTLEVEVAERLPRRRRRPSSATAARGITSRALARAVSGDDGEPWRSPASSPAITARRTGWSTSLPCWRSCRAAVRATSAGISPRRGTRSPPRRALAPLLQQEQGLSPRRGRAPLVRRQLRLHLCRRPPPAPGPHRRGRQGRPTR